MPNFDHLSLPKKIYDLINMDQRLLEKYNEKYWIWMIAGDNTQLIELNSGNESLISSVGQACFFICNNADLITMDRQSAIAAVKAITFDKALFDSGDRLEAVLQEATNFLTFLGDEMEATSLEKKGEHLKRVNPAFADTYATALARLKHLKGGEIAC